MKQLTLVDIDCVVIETGSSPRYSVIWLHGLGADANDFVPIVPQLVHTQRQATRFVFPNASMRPVSINGGMRMRAWYDILGIDVARDQDLAGIADSVDAIDRLIAHELDTAKVHGVVLAGFSQGGAIALRAGLASKRPLLGIVALSTYLLQGESLLDWAHPSSTWKPNYSADTPLIWMGHGTHDPIVPIGLGEAAKRQLTDAGWSVDWYTWPMGHEVCLPEIEQLDRQMGDWMRAH